MIKLECGCEYTGDGWPFDRGLLAIAFRCPNGHPGLQDWTFTPTARSLYAFNPRQGAASIARYHAVLDQPYQAQRYSRAKGDALCKPRAKFWGLTEGNPSPVNCPRCKELAERFGIVVREV